jgi:hypothetical protein
MLKPIIVLTAALAIAGTSLVYAQHRQHDGAQGQQSREAQHRQHGGRSDDDRGWRPSAEDRRAFGEARLAALKAGLMLSPEQERSWPAFEQAARELTRLRSERRQAMRDAPQTGDPAERLRQRGNAMSDMGAALRRLADATDPLYKSLDESQKRRFAMLSRFTGMGGEGHHGRGRHHWRGGGEGPHHHHHQGPRRTGVDDFERGHPGAERL